MSSEIQSLLLKNDNDLLLQLGQELYKDQAGALPLSSKQLIERAKKWLSQLLLELRPKLCNNEIIKAVHNKKDSITLIGAIIDIIAKQNDMVSPATAAILIFRIGVDKICATSWH